ncbi:PilZ domain-containing protein [Thermodesulfobacteriota bacterium]
MEQKARQKAHASNLRKYPRGICMVNAKLKINGQAVSCATKNLTPEGVFIITREDLTVGDNIALSFTLPQSSGLLQISGKVVRNHLDGVGVKFDTTLLDLLKPA